MSAPSRELQKLWKWLESNHPELITAGSNTIDVVILVMKDLKQYREKADDINKAYRAGQRLTWILAHPWRAAWRLVFRRKIKGKDFPVETAKLIIEEK